MPNSVHWRPLPAWAVIVGVGTSVVVKLVAVTIALFAGALLTGRLGEWGAWFLIGGVTTLVAGIVDFVLLRVVSIRKQHDQPGSVVITAVDLLIVPAVAFVVGPRIAGTEEWLVPALITIAVLIAFILILDRPWRSGMTREESSRAYGATKQMTKEMLADEVESFKQWRRERYRGDPGPQNQADRA